MENKEILREIDKKFPIISESNLRNVIMEAIKLTHKSKQVCSICGKRDAETQECQDCYIKGAIKERKKEQKRILKCFKEFEKEIKELKNDRT